jgi:hypothetical protein
MRSSRRDALSLAVARGLVMPFMACVLAAGCAAADVTRARSGVEQRLIVRSLDRAVAGMDIARFSGKKVTLEVISLSDDRTFAKDFIAARLSQRGIEIVKEADKADLRLKILATALGIDHRSKLLGVPALTIPFVAFPIPEIPIFKQETNHGHTEMEILAYEPKRDRLVDFVPSTNGRAKYDEFTVLLFVSFIDSDLDRYPVRTD